MEIERIEETQLTASDDVLINSLLAGAFKEDFGRRSFHQQRHTLRLLVRHEDRIIGHMALCYRAIRMGPDLVNIMGLAEVATDPDFQGRGIASALMTAAIAEARASQAVFFLLFGVRPLYAGAGFRPVHNRITHVDYYRAHTGGLHTVDDHDLMVLELTAQVWDDQAHIDLLGHNF